jgi:hypothetical protein
MTMQDLISSTFRRRPVNAPRAVRVPRQVRMRGAVQLTATPQADADRVVYQPPQLLAKYERAKLIGGLLFAAIFAGWLWLQWSNPWMRVAAGALLLLTAWITASSIVTDLRRHQGRQIELAGRALLVTTPEGTCWIQLPDVAVAQWTDDAGLRFDRADGQTLGRIDLVTLADEDEARRFLGWLRQHAQVDFAVQWPQRG